MADRAGPIQRINVNEATTGVNVLVAGRTGERLLLVNTVLMAFGRVDVTLEDTAGTDMVGPLPFAANGGVSMPDSEVGWAATASGRGLRLRLSANVQVTGSLGYRFIPDHLDM